MSLFHRYRGLTPFLLLLPGLLWLGLFFVAPLGFLGYQSLQSGTFETGYTFDWAFSNYWDAISSYHEQFVRSFLYAGIATLLQFVALGQVTDVGDLAIPSQRRTREALRVARIHLGDVRGQRTIDEHRNARNLLLLGQLVDRKNELLRAAYGEGRNDDSSAAIRCPIDGIGQLVFHNAHILVKAVAIGAFHNQVVAGRARLRVRDDGQTGAAHITGEDESSLRAGFFQLEGH